MDDKGPIVLVVEDDELLRESISTVLREEGYDAIGACDGSDALDRLRGMRHAGRPRVILLDLLMPVMNAAEFCRRQREDPALASIPIVVLSADRQVRREAARLGAEGFLRKPFSLEALMNLLDLLGQAPYGPPRSLDPVPELVPG